MKSRQVRKLTRNAALLLALSLPMAAETSADLKQFVEPAKDYFAAGNYKEAIKLLKKAQQKSQNSCVECAILLSAAYVRMGNVFDARTACERTLKTTTDPVELALLHSQKGMVGAAAARQIDHSPFIRDEAREVRSQPFWREAEQEFAAATALDPGRSTLHFNHAVALINLHREAEAKKELAKFLEMDPKSKSAEDAKLYMEQPRLATLETPPPFSVTTIDGKSVSLQSLRGRVVVLDFWATWCPPCRESVPDLRELTQKYPSDKLTVLSISNDEKEQTARDYIAKHGMTWPQYFDKDKNITKLFGVGYFPTYIVIGPEGEIEHRIVGENPQQRIVTQLKKSLEEMFALETPKEAEGTAAKQ